ASFAPPTVPSSAWWKATAPPRSPSPWARIASPSTSPCPAKPSPPPPPRSAPSSTKRASPTSSKAAPLPHRANRASRPERDDSTAGVSGTRVHEVELWEPIKRIGFERERIDSGKVARSKSRTDLLGQCCRDGAGGGHANAAQILRLEAQVAASHLDGIGPDEKQRDPGAKQASQNLQVPLV